MSVLTHLGFTGTRHPLTVWQSHMVVSIIQYHRMLGFTHFHHGDCVGADNFAARTAYDCGYYVISHPPIKTVLRAYAPSHEIRAARDYLARNNDIVAESHAGLGAPNTETLVAESGTWLTINRMRDVGLPYWVVTPTTCYCSELLWTPIAQTGN